MIDDVRLVGYPPQPVSPASDILHGEEYSVMVSSSKCVAVAESCGRG